MRDSGTLKDIKLSLLLLSKLNKISLTAPDLDHLTKQRLGYDVLNVLRTLRTITLSASIVNTGKQSWYHLADMEPTSDNPLRDFINQIQRFIFKNSYDAAKKCHLVKQNTDRLAQCGDFCLPNDESIWSTYCTAGRTIGIDGGDGNQLNLAVAATMLERCNADVLSRTRTTADNNCTAKRFLFGVSADAAATNNDDNVKLRPPRKSCNSKRHSNETERSVAGGCNDCIYNVGDIIAASKHWTLAIDRAVCDASRCLLFIDRRQTFNLFMRLALLPIDACAVGSEPNYSTHFGRFEKQPGKVIKVTSDPVVQTDSASVTQYRLSVVQSVLINLINASQYTIFSDAAGMTASVPSSETAAMHHVHLTTKSSSAVPVNVFKVIVGTVQDPQQQNKLATITAADYIK